MPDNDFRQQVGTEIKGIYSKFRSELGNYSPSSELTRRKWNRSKNDMGEMYRLSEKFGQKKVGEWIERNKVRDSLGG